MWTHDRNTRSLPCFPLWRILLLLIVTLLFCYFVSALHPPALLANLKYAYSPCVLSSFFFLALLMLACLLSFSSLPSLFRFRFGHRLFSSCLFLVGTMLLGFGFCCDSFSILYTRRFAPRAAYAARYACLGRKNSVV